MTQNQQAAPTPFAPLASNRKAVNLVAMGSSRQDFTSLQMMEQRPEMLQNAEVWVINYLGAAWRCDRIIHIDPVHPYLGNPVVRDMCDNALRDGTPLYTSWPHPLYPNHRIYPFHKVVRALNSAYLNTSVSAAIALALFEGFNEINLFGCDFSYPNAHISESGRACCEFWLGVASQRGVRIGMAATTTLLDTHCGQHPYGWFANPLAPPVNGGKLMDMGEVITHCERWEEDRRPKATFYRYDPARPMAMEPFIAGGHPHPEAAAQQPFGLHGEIYTDLEKAANLSLIALQNATAAQKAGVVVKLNGAAPPSGVDSAPDHHNVPSGAER